MEVELGKVEQCSKRWRLQTFWLTDIENRIDQYFELNKEEITASIRWEVFKAYIRGEIISYTSAKNKQCNQEIQSLETQINHL